MPDSVAVVMLARLVSDIAKTKDKLTAGTGTVTLLCGVGIEVLLSLLGEVDGILSLVFGRHLDWYYVVW